MADPGHRDRRQLAPWQHDRQEAWQHLAVSLVMPLLALLWIVTGDPQWLPMLVVYGLLALLRALQPDVAAAPRPLAAVAAVAGSPIVMVPTVLLLAAGAFRSYTDMPLIARGPLSLVVGFLLYFLALVVDGLVRVLLRRVRGST